MKISVIIPIYNAEKYLQDCIDSIRNQSYQNFELILINDGSTDNSETICKKYVEMDERIHLISQDNAGVSAARNRGIQEMTGDYLFFQDADDKLMPNAFSYLAGKLEQTKADVIIFGWKEINLYKPESRVVIPGEAGKIATDTVIRQILSDNEACGGGYPWNKIWRTAAIRENGQIGMFAEDIFAYEDKLWIIENLKKVKRIYIDTYIWYEYYCRVDSLSHHIHNGILKNGIQAYYRMVKALKGYDIELYQYAKEEYFSRIITDIIVSYRQQNKELLEWMTEKFLKHNGEIYHSKRLGWKFKVKTFFIESYLKKHRKQFCIGYLLKNYPEQRCIINKILSKEYQYKFQTKKISKYTLFFLVCQKLHLYQSKYAFAIYDPLFGTNVDFIHAFNTVCDIKKPWCASFEAILPRTDYLLEKEGQDREFKKLDYFSGRAFQLMKQKKCKAILPLSEYAKNLEICLINNAPITEKEIIFNKMYVLHPPQALLSSLQQIEEKYSILTDKPNFIFVGRAFFRKGGKHLYKVLQKLRERYEFHLTIISDLEAEDYITHTSKKEACQWKKILNETNWITYYERLENKKVLELCRQSHIGFLPTLADTYGFSVLEMQACGCPVVTTDVNALPEINNNETGWVCRLPKSSLGDILYHSLEEKQKADKQLMAELEKNIIEALEHKNTWKVKAIASLKRIDEQHNPKRYAENLREIYRQ